MQKIRFNRWTIPMLAGVICGSGAMLSQSTLAHDAAGGWCTIIPDECGVTAPGGFPGETPPEDTLLGGSFGLRALGNSLDWMIDYVQFEPVQLDPELVECIAEQITEEERDVLAQEIADEILTKPDRDSVEYGAGIFVRSDGTYGRTPLYNGTSCGGTVSIPFYASQVGNGGRIIGDVHNHPRPSSCPAFSGNNGPSPSDWQDVQTNYIDVGLTSQQEFALYFLDFNNQLAEFDSENWGDTLVENEHLQDGAGNCGV